MQRTSFREMACSIARTLDVIGEPWSPLILRDVWVGMNRFDEIQADLGISRKVLTERLNHLVEHGVLERRPYDRRPRYEYHLTAKGTELVDVLMVMAGWGDRWLAGEPGPAGALPPSRLRGGQWSRTALRPLWRADARGRCRRDPGPGQRWARAQDDTVPAALTRGIQDRDRPHRSEPRRPGAARVRSLWLVGGSAAAGYGPT